MGLYTLHTPRLGSRFKAAQSIWKLREIPQLRCFRRLGAPVFEGPCRKILGQKIRSTSFEGPCSKILGQKIRGTLFEGPCSKVLVCWGLYWRPTIFTAPPRLRCSRRFGRRMPIWSSSLGCSKEGWNRQSSNTIDFLCGYTVIFNNRVMGQHRQTRQHGSRQ